MGESSDEKCSEKLVDVSGRNSQDAMYTIRWADGHTSRYPFVWLRDNCRCTKCYHPPSYQRLQLIAELDTEVKPKAEDLSGEGSVLKVLNIFTGLLESFGSMKPNTVFKLRLILVTWPDNDHVGEYPSHWLRQHQFDKGFYDPIGDIKPKPWGSELNDNIPKYKYEDILNNNDVLFEWLKTLCETGLAILTGAPKKLGALETISKRVAYLRETIYGKEFQVSAKVNASASTELGLHVDLPYYDCCPGVQLLHCIHQTEGIGGDNQFADAVHVALILKKEQPELYKLLTTVDIYHRHCHGTQHIDDCHLINGKPLLELDGEGNFKQVNYSDIVRAAYLNVPVEKVLNVYRAIKLFHHTMYKNNINTRLRDGEIVTFNNTRVLHGRMGYSLDSCNGEAVRHYQGGYLEWDEVYSRMRILREAKEGKLRV